jgi:translation initiation factor IF-2
MNNGKIRIYDLSKELHLDNKDILEICDKLNIAVKSHSSTISESDAERIKLTAEKYPPSHGAAKSSASDGGSSSAVGQAPAKRKQQILAIHHKQVRAKATDLLTPPRPPGKPQAPAPAPVSPPANELVQPGTPQAVAVSAAPKPKSTARAAEKAPLSPKREAPQLLQPPSRTSPGAVEEKVEQSPPLQPPAQAEAAPEEGKAGKKKAVREKVSKKAGPQSKPQLELQRPQPPKPSKPEAIEEQPPLELEEVVEEAIEEEGLELPEKQKPKLKRPTPPRTLKRPGWEEEEEEEREIQSKAGKGAGKAKRRTQPILDDEEDFAEELEGIALATPTVSLSIARPPKPKSEAKPTAPTSRAKKAPTKPEPGLARTKTEKREQKEAAKRPEQVVLSGSLTLRELSDLLKVPETEMIKNLFSKGIAVNITQTLDLETARLIAEEFDIEVETIEEKASAAKSTEMLDAADLENLQRRPPVVTIMGHVDHGKTTLLDSIRQTKVAQGEAGGITQHIGAYHVDLEHEDKPEQIVFLDTPGHEAFTAMRARGARVTDIAVLVVAADDGVQPQTREAISHARAAEVPIVVAINKIDKPEANPDRVKQELAELGLVAEDWGGDTIMVPVSALRGENLDGLLEMLLLVAEMEELSANPERSARGTVIEANLDRTRGPVATLLVQNGTLRVGDIIVAGSVYGKIRAMIDDRGSKVEQATPSFAVEILGLNDVPAAGDEFEVYSNEKEARTLAEHRLEEKRQSRLQQEMSARRVTLTSLSAQAQEGQLKELNLILKADVQGSVEAILGALQQLPQREVQIRVLLAAPGEITETDVALAAASGAVVVGFNTTLASGSRQAADQEGVDIREYDIIYKLLDDIQGAMEGLLEPEEVEEALGTAEVRVVFPSGRGFVAGCYVQSGKIVRNRLLRVRRGGEVIYQGTIDSLKRFQEDAREVNAGYECGIGTAKFNDWKEGDIIEAYEMSMKRRTLSLN